MYMCHVWSWFVSFLWRIRMIPPWSLVIAHIVPFRCLGMIVLQEADRRILLDHRVEAVLKQATSCHSGWPLLGMVGKKNPIFNESLDIQMPPLWGLTFKEPQKNHTKKLTLPMEVFGYLEVVHLKWEWNFSYPHCIPRDWYIYPAFYHIKMNQIWANLP